jgi:hypothetical protein
MTQNTLLDIIKECHCRFNNIYTKRFANNLIVFAQECESKSMLLPLIFDVPSSFQDFKQTYPEEISIEHPEQVFLLHA